MHTHSQSNSNSPSGLLYLNFICLLSEIQI
ncbi:hypothetical protein CPL00146S_CDS0072 [Escherichia phage SmurfNell]|uniref:Uncharacterized protein n=1 Tax=Salmonella phage vB_SenS_SB13 TaxID=2591135 RepID=A0A5J6TAV0_9CAUD|nr:hypothetical protein HWC37_gp071 [Salmonella phage vB_SenS_SB13]QFG07605.1 hypothetical protein [Salmonella phage vB_SenS_SB13]